MSCNEHNSTNKFFFWENFRVACQNDVPQIFSHFYSLSLSFNLFCVLKFHHYKKTLGIESTNEPKCECGKKYSCAPVVIIIKRMTFIFVLYIFISIISIYAVVLQPPSILLIRYFSVSSNRQQTKIKIFFCYDRKIA